MERCRRRVQQYVLGYHGRASDPLYRARCLLRIGTDLLTDRQGVRLQVLFATEEHVEVEATWGIYPKMVTVSATPDAARP